MQPLISVIVTVYKVEDCLVNCLDSLCRQTLTNIEIILIDDASPDRCGDICDEYAFKDARFRVFHNKTNQGLSVARNIGIANATCDWLMFVDSDDWVHEDFCKDSYECAVRYQVDLVLFRFLRVKKDVYNKSFKDDNPFSFRPSGYLTQIEALELLQGDVKNGVGQAAWNKLYKKQLFNDINYPPGYWFEDMGTTYKTVFQASRIFFLDKVLYYKCFRSGSITTLKNEKVMHDWIEMHLQQYYDLAAWGYPSDKLRVLLTNIAFDYCIKKKPHVSDENYNFCANVLLNCDKTPANFTWKMKILLLIFKYNRPLFEYVCKLYDLKVC